MINICIFAIREIILTKLKPPITPNTRNSVGCFILKLNQQW